MRQIFVSGNFEQDELERKLYIARKQAENQVRNSAIKNKEAFYLPSLSTKVMIYKGLFTSHQLRQYFTDLRDPKLRKRHCAYSLTVFNQYLSHLGSCTALPFSGT